MAKKKSKKPSDQAELPLDAAPAASEDRKPKTEDSPKSSKLAPASPQLAEDEPRRLVSPKLGEGGSPAGEGGQSPNAAPSPDAQPPKRKKGQKVQDEPAPLAQAYRNWFLDYASYVILDRAVPHLDDGLKPVQRR